MVEKGGYSVLLVLNLAALKSAKLKPPISFVCLSGIWEILSDAAGLFFCVRLVGDVGRLEVWPKICCHQSKPSRFGNWRCPMLGKRRESAGVMPSFERLGLDNPDCSVGIRTVSCRCVPGRCLSCRRR